MTPSQLSVELTRIAASAESESDPRAVTGDLRRILAAIGSPAIEIEEVTATVRGTWDGEEFEATIGWNPGTGDPADFELLSGPPEVEATSLLDMIDVKSSNASRPPG